MRRRSVLLASCLLATAASLPTAHAQLIQVRKGYVRAPFVRVERNPGRRTRVRAPFVEVGPRDNSQPVAPTPGYQPPVEPTVVPETDVTASFDVSEMSWQGLQQTILVNERELDQELSQFAAGDYWRRTLQIGVLNELLADESDTPPSLNLRNQLQQILGAYDNAAINPTARPIVELTSYQSVRAALRELLLSPEERQRGRLISAAGQFEQTLARNSQLTGWTDYLRLPESLFTPDQNATFTSTQSATLLEELLPVLTRYDATSQDPQYEPVASLPEFQSAHQQLAAYVELLNQPQQASDEYYIIRQQR